MALKLIDASEVTVGGTKKSVVKKTAKISTKSDDKIVVKDIVKSVTKPEDKSDDKGSIKSEDKSGDKGSIKSEDGVRAIRTIKLMQDVYYGPNDENKKKFVKMYKKLGLVWKTEYINGAVSDGWFNRDKSQYIIKLSEEGEFKRFKFYGCDEIYDYFVALGAITFDYKDNLIDANKTTVDNAIGIKIGNDTEEYDFIGADLWSGYRTRQLLKNVPDNWGVIWK